KIAKPYSALIFLFLFLSRKKEKKLLHLPIKQIDNPFTIFCIFLRMSDLYNRHPLIVELFEESHNPLTLFGIEVTGWFICQQQFGRSCQCPGYTYDLLLPAG